MPRGSEIEWSRASSDKAPQTAHFGNGDPMWPPSGSFVPIAFGRKIRLAGAQDPALPETAVQHRDKTLEQWN